MALTDSLIAYWELEESSGSRIDAHGSNDLSDNNTVLSGTGIVGTAANFTDANSEYLSRADNTDLSTGDVDYSFVCWIKLDDVADESRIINKWTSQVEYLLEEGGDTNNRFTWWISGTSASANVTADTFGDTSGISGSWVFVFVYHDAAASEIGISINDGGIDTTSLSITQRDGTDPFQLSYNSSTLGIEGLLDQVGFWKKKLTAAEVTRLYNSGNGRSYATLDVTLQIVAGSITNTGSLILDSRKIVAGSITNTGALLKRIPFHIGGTIDNTGALLKRFPQRVAGVIANVGVLRFRFPQRVAGEIINIGALRFRFPQRLVGVIENVGSLRKRFPQRVAGVIANTGAFKTLRRKVLFMILDKQIEVDMSIDVVLVNTEE